MRIVKRDDLKSKIDHNERLVLIDVLAKEDFDDFHLPNAQNVPVRSTDFDNKVQQLVPDKEEPVVVYCSDLESTISRDAANRLEKLGYKNVMDYAEGKIGWKAAGFPIEH